VGMGNSMIYNYILILAKFVNGTELESPCFLERPSL
jgi:hypothetical protein